MQARTAFKRRAFLAAFRRHGNVMKAARAAKINPDTHYAWLRVDATYKSRFDDARDGVLTKRARFLNAYAACGNVTRAANAVGINRDSHYGWLQADATYKAEFERMIGGKPSTDAAASTNN